MNRRQLLQRGTALIAAAGLARPALVRAASASTLKFVPYADLALTDPLVPAFVTRNHAMMVYDTLFALDEAGNPQPQMLQGYVAEDDGRTWKLTLRDGLRFHDNTPVLGRDVVATLRRWSVRDSFGAALFAVTEELSAPSDKVVQFRLKRPFPLFVQALSQPNSPFPGIMPERLAQTPPFSLVSEIVGSGPYKFMPGERVPGARNVYARFEGYVPRGEGTPSFGAGPRVAYFDRVEWQTTPDPGTQIAALQAGEVDWVEQPVMDLVPTLRRDSTLKIEPVETHGLIGALRFNCLFPPFDNPAIRRAALKAVRQRDYMEAVAGDDASIWNDHVGFFPPGTPMASDAGMENLNGKHDPAELKREVIEAGYKGERVVFLGASDVAGISAICLVGADMLRRIGFNVDYVSTDWGTVIQRQTRKQPLDQGGWSMFGSFWSPYNWITPAGHLPLRGNGLDAFPGWPTAPKLEALRQDWLAASDLATQQAIARKIQLQAMEDAPILPLGLYYQPTAYRADLTGMLKGLPLFTNLRRA